VKKFSFKKKIFVSIMIVATVTAVVLGFSYHMMYMLLYASDNVYYGQKQSVISQEIREELFKLNEIKNVKFKTVDNIMLSGIVIKRPKAKANLLLCHGYRSSKELMYGYIDLFPEFNIMLFDFRAHGQSEGKIISIGCHEFKDVSAAAQFMKEFVCAQDGGQLPLIALGISMGAASIIKAASVEPNLCDALIIDSTFSDLHKILIKGFSIKAGLPYYPFFPIIRYIFEVVADCKVCAMNPAKCVEKITKPIFFIHSCNDSFISPKHCMRLYEHAGLSRYAKIWIAPTCRHGWLHSYYSDIYRKKVTGFLRKAINLNV
jgi:uncharacterized protein